MKIKKTHVKTREVITALVDSNWNQLETAFGEHGGNLNFGIRVHLSGGESTVSVVATLEFYPLPKVKVKSGPVSVDEKQMKLTLKDVKKDAA